MVIESTPSLGRPRGSDRHETERRLLQSATELFAARGYFGVGIREIASESGFTVASLYHYVKSKEELLERLMQRALGEFSEHARVAAQSSDDPVRQLVALVEMSVIFHAVNRRTARVVDKEIDALGQEARERVIRMRDDYENIWTKVLEKGSQDALFKVAHISLTRLSLLGMCAEVAYWYSPLGRLGITELRAHYVDMALSLVSVAPSERPASPLGQVDYASFAVEEPDTALALLLQKGNEK